jgi:DNA-binding NarL/FixJ family response regulator
VHILVCDDHAVFAEALARLLRRRGFEVTTSLDPTDAQKVVGERPIDVCLMDLRFASGVDGVDGAHRVRMASPTTAVLIISGATGDETIRAAMAAKACGCISKTVSAERVVASLLRAHAGSSFFAEVGDTGRRHRGPEERGGDAERLASLTLREAEVLQHMVSGETAALIGKQLGITYATVRAHVQRVLVKLGTHSAVETVALAARNGLRPEAATARSRVEPFSATEPSARHGSIPAVPAGPGGPR